MKCSWREGWRRIKATKGELVDWKQGRASKGDMEQIFLLLSFHISSVWTITFYRVKTVSYSLTGYFIVGELQMNAVVERGNLLFWQSWTRGEKRLLYDSAVRLLLNVWLIIWCPPTSAAACARLIFPFTCKWCNVTITHCHPTAALRLGDLSISAGLEAVSLYICWSLILIVFQSSASKDSREQ